MYEIFVQEVACLLIKTWQCLFPFLKPNAHNFLLTQLMIVLKHYFSDEKDNCLVSQNANCWVS